MRTKYYYAWLILILGPLAMNPNRAMAVDFSRGVGYGFTAVVIPLETNSNMWYITGPFSNTVWFLIVISIPLYSGFE